MINEHQKLVEKLISTVCTELQSIVTTQGEQSDSQIEGALLRCEALLVEARGVVSGEVNVDDVDARTNNDYVPVIGPRDEEHKAALDHRGQP